ncbi:MAG TPA: hypothetical protein PKY53_06995 [Clostridia bacterium]|jgi:hypothetical protein|nr:hypothetical protein [Clostridia bacterium]
MKKTYTVFAFVLIVLTILTLAGCGKKDVVVDGIKLSDPKFIENETEGTGLNGTYKTIRFSCIVENTTDTTLTFEVVCSYRRGDVFTMKTVTHKEQVTLGPKESKSISYTTDRIGGGIIDSKKIFVHNVIEA